MDARNTGSELTLYDFRLSTTQASSASRPIVTVMLGIGSANRGKFESETHQKIFLLETYGN